MWTKIKNYPNYSLNPDTGKCKNNLTNKEVGYRTNRGYIIVDLPDKTSNRGSKGILLHRLMAETFLPNPHNKKTVDHINQDAKDDNRIINLRWATNKEQNNNKKKWISIGKRKKVIRLDKNSGEELEQYDSIKLAHNWCIQNGYCQENVKGGSHIGHACKKGGNSYGFKWKYLEDINEIFKDEIFLPISKDEENVEGWKISENGILKTPKGEFRDTRKIKPSRGGYISTKINGKTRSIHRLVAKTFLPNPKNKKNVEHIDGDKTNFKKNNLKWVTQKENVNLAYDNNLNSSSIKMKVTNVEEGTFEIYRSKKEITRKLSIQVKTINKYILENKIHPKGYKFEELKN